MEDKIKHYKLGNTIQEFEEMFGNVPFNDIEKIKKYLLQNYIPKSKIKEKIEEIQGRGLTVYLGGKSGGKTLKQIVNTEIIRVLQELMEDK